MRYSVFVITIMLLTACNLALPAGESAPVVETSAQIQPLVTNAIETGVPQVDGTAISYWRFANITDVTPADTDIVIFGLGVLAEVESATVRTGIPATDIEIAMQDMINSNNIWTAENIVIESVIIDGDMVTIRLSGTISAVGGAILSMVPIQFQLTVFEEQSINRALITLNGQNLANLGASHESQLVANDVPFTRDGLNTSLLVLQ